MPRLIVTSRYIKNKGSNVESLVKYIGTREGVELNSPVNALVNYMGQRPGVVKNGAHGLFDSDDAPIDLKKIAEEFSSHKGRIYTHVISLTREDAEQLGFVSQQAWKNLLRSQSVNIAKNMGITLERFRWIAAFHNTEHHPHVHMMCYDTENKSFLKEQGLDNIRSSIAKEIFREDLTAAYSEKTRLRDDVRKYSKEYMEQLTKTLDGEEANMKIALLLTELSSKLKGLNGKKQYAFMPREIKVIVDDIVKELSQIPQIAEMYRGWCAVQNSIMKTYRNNLADPQPLWERKEFKSIKNAAIQVALSLPVGGINHLQEEKSHGEKEKGDQEKQAQTLQAEAAEESTDTQTDSAGNAYTEEFSNQSELSAIPSPQAITGAVTLAKYLSNFIKAEHAASYGRIGCTERKLLIKEAAKKLEQGQKLE